MPSQDEIRVCTEMTLPDELVIPAAEVAIEENSINRPAIHFTPGMGVAPLSPFELAALTGKKWDNGRTLRVRFLDGDPTVQEKLQPYAHAWSDHANIKLVFGDDPDAEIRISFSLKGSWSYLGTDCLSIPQHQPTMNFGWLTPTTSDQEYSRVVTHEFGHALGCYHEHQHPTHDIPWDKDAVYEYYQGPPNNWSKAQVDQNLFKKYSKTISQFSAFDTASIMLYSIPNKFTLGDYEVGWNTELSPTDKEFVGVMYPKDEKKFVDLEIDALPMQARIGAHGEEDFFTFEVVDQGQYEVKTVGWTDVVLYLFGPDDPETFIGMDDDSGFWRNASLRLDLDPGQYFVKVRHHKPKKKGTYFVAVNSQE